MNKKFLNELQSGEKEFSSIGAALKESTKKNALNRLLALGAIELEYGYEQNVKERKVEWLVVSGDLIQYIESIPKSHSAKLKLAKYLVENPVVKRLEVQDSLKNP